MVGSIIAAAAFWAGGMWARRKGAETVPGTSPKGGGGAVKRVEDSGQVPAVKAAVAKWKLQFLELSEDSQAHIAKGEEKLALDTTSGYADAAEAFQKALVLDPENDRAIAGFVEAVALGVGARLEDAEYEEALSLVTAAEKRSPTMARPLIAHALLLLARPSGSRQDARVLAEKAISLGDQKEQALAQLALGEALVSTSTTQAVEAFEKALSLDPSLKRGHLFRSRMFELEGDYGKAISSLEKRLELDVDQWEVTEALARIYVEVGELGPAAKVFERAGTVSIGSARARLALAVLAYQHEQRASKAVGLLNGIISEKERFDTREIVDALGHLAGAERITGQLDSAAAHAKAALDLDPDDVNARLQAFLGAMDRRKLDEAAAHFPFLVGRLGDPALEKLLEGRLQFAQAQFPQAMQLFERAAELDPRRTDALVLAGAAASRIPSKAHRAYEFVLGRAIRGDPNRLAPARVMSRIFLRRSDLLGDAVGQFDRLSTGADDPNPALCEGLVQFHLGNLAQAEQRFVAVNGIDQVNSLALAYRSLLALKRGERSSAVRLGTSAAQADGASALALYAQGCALMGSQKWELAGRALRDALAIEPKSLAIRVALGNLEAQTGQVAEGKKQLAAVVGIDPSYLEAKRALFLMTKQGDHGGK